MWGSIIQGLISPVTGLFKQRGERKRIVEVAKAQGQLAKDNAEAHVTASVAKWEAIMAEATKSSPKDEIALVTLLMPLWGVFAGSIVKAFTGSAAVLDASQALINTIPQYGLLLTLAISASFGIRLVR